MRETGPAATALGKGLLVARPRSRSIAGATLVALLLSCALAARVGWSDHFRFLRPIRAGADYARPAVLLPGQAAEPGRGYDGQFYFYLAEDPFLRDPATARSLDNTFRVRRILYPLLAWALALGQRSLVPFTLVLVNVLALTGLVALCALAAERAGRSGWWGLLPLLYAGTWVPLLLDLTEPLQLLLLAAGAASSSAGLLLGAALAKESAGVALATEAVRHGLARRWRAAGRHAAAAVAFLAWAAFVYLAVKGPPYNWLGGFFLDPPGAPFLSLGARAGLAALPAVAICLGALVRPLWVRDGAAWAAAAYGLLALGAGNDTWTDPAAYFRVSAGALVLVYLSWCSARDRVGAGVLAAGALAGLLSLAIVLTS